MEWSVAGFLLQVLFWRSREKVDILVFLLILVEMRWVSLCLSWCWLWACCKSPSLYWEMFLVSPVSSGLLSWRDVEEQSRYRRLPKPAEVTGHRLHVHSALWLLTHCPLESQLLSAVDLPLVFYKLSVFQECTGFISIYCALPQLLEEASSTSGAEASPL